MNSSNAPARIKIGISTYNGSAHLELLLQSIRWYTLIEEPFDVVVCDDGSTQDELDKTQMLCDKFGATLIKNGINQGIPATWNHLVGSLGGPAEINVILNNDICVTPQWLTVGVHFLDANKDNPIVGSCYWNPQNGIPLDARRRLLPELTHTIVQTRNIVDGKPRDFHSGGPMEVRHGEHQGLGRVMAPCGCCFAFRREVWEKVGPFDENIKSFFEETDWGTRCAAQGMASFGFPYPSPLHEHGATFAANHELNSGPRMAQSRAYYRSKHGVPSEEREDFTWINHKHMSLIPQTQLTFLSPDYTRPLKEYKRPGGEIVKMPQLVEQIGLY